MDSAWYAVGGLLLVSAPPAAIVATIYLYRWRDRSKKRRNPLTKALLNSPGVSLRADLRKNEDDLMALYLAAAAFGAYIGGFMMGQNFDERPGIYVWAMVGATSIIILSYMVNRVYRLFRRIQSQRLGLDGEMATGEELNQLMRRGYHVFHDIPGTHYNIDHAVVGPNGVFAVETKTHAKPANGHQASFDGQVISYPDRKDFTAVEQAQRNARSLGEYLSKAAGRPIQVQPIVVLPGWCVNLTGPSNRCNVLASGQVQSWLPRITSAKLTLEEVTAIAFQLERVCRSEKPMAFSESDKRKYATKLAI